MLSGRKKQQKKTTQSYHPSFRTKEQANANPAHSYSDHLPCLYKNTPADYDNGLSVNILSWNIFNPGFASGYDMPDSNFGRNFTGNMGQTLPAEQERINSITESMTKMRELHDVGIFTLQEVSDYALVALREYAKANGLELISTYASLGMGSDPNHLVTLYDPAKVTCLNSERTERHDFPGGRLNLQTLLFAHNEARENGQPFAVTNAHVPHADIPANTEQLINQTLAEDQGNLANHIMVGDFNSRVAPKFPKKENIVSGLTPCVFDQEDKFGTCDWTDGAFCLSARKNPIQLDREILSPESGEPVRAPASTDGLTELQVKKMQEYRICVAVDALYAEPHGNDMQNGKSIFEYEADMQRKFRDPTLLIRPASNAFNERAVTIVCSNTALYQFLKHHLAFKGVQNLQTIDQPSQRFMPDAKEIFVPTGDAAFLAQELDSVSPLCLAERAAVSKYINEHPEKKSTLSKVKRFAGFGKTDQTLIAAQKLASLYEKFGSDPTILTLINFALADSRVMKILSPDITSFKNIDANTLDGDYRRAFFNLKDKEESTPLGLALPKLVDEIQRELKSPSLDHMGGLVDSLHSTTMPAPEYK